MRAWIHVDTIKENAQPVAYDSHSFNSAQCNYSTHERELLAIVHALDHWHPFHYGIPVYTFTDHFVLKQFLGQCNLSLQQICWLDILKDFDVFLNTSKGKTISQQITSNDTLVLTCSHLLTQCYLTENYTLALAVTFAPTLSLEIILAIALEI